MWLTGFHNVHGSSKNHKKKKGIIREKILFVACSTPLAPTLFHSVRSSPEDVLIESSTIEMKAEGKS
jgi:hypothetical protein